MSTYRAGVIVTIGLLVLASTGAAAPTVQSMTPPAGAAVGSLTQISISFNEAVANVDADDLLINGESAAAITGSGAGPYVFTFTQPAPGTINVSWDLDHGMSGLGTGNFVAPPPWSYTLNDTVPPVAGQLTPAAGSTVGSLTQLEVIFTEPVTGVEAADLLVNGQPAVSVTGDGLGPYLFAFPLPAFGSVEFAWKIDDTIVPPRISIFDAAGNAVAASAWSVTRRAEGIGSLVITEFLAANGTGLADENGDQEDWMEIYNPGATAVNLTGWGVTNEADQFAKWVFPNWSLDPGRFIVVYASGKDRRPTQRTAGQDNANTVASPRLHTNFKLNENGDYLALIGPQSPRVAVSHFTPEFPAQRFNYSYGTVAGGALRYFATPTPGVLNGASTLTAFTPSPATSVERGFFSEPFSLVLTCADASAVIRYTTNGDEPTVSTGTVYAGPINVSTTTVFRAAAFATNSVPSRTVTQSYIFLDAVLNQPANPAGFPATWGTNGNFPNSVIPADYAMDMDPMRVDPNNPNSPIDAVKLQRLKDGLRELPIMSVVLKTNDMFGAGGLYPTSSASNKAPNEKACSVEMILPDGSTAFSTTCGIRLHGNASRDPHKNPKHGFKLNFKGDYGAATLEYRLFPDSPVEEFDDIILRPDFNSSWRHWSDDTGNANGAFQRSRGTRTRDAWVKETQREMGGVASHNRYVHLFINGLYWGTFDASEQPTADFAAAYLGGNEATMDIYDQGALKNGTATVYNAMSALSSLGVNTNYEQMKRYLDLPEFIDYMMLHFYFGHQDWGVNKNWYAIRRADGTFKYVSWDGECVLLDTTVNRVTNTDVPTNLHTRLVANAQYKLDFADRVHRHMIRPNGTLMPAMNIARWQKWQAVMDKPVVAESARWGDYRRDVHPYQTGSYLLYTRENHWMAENNRLVGTYFPNRTNTVLGQLRSAGLYPSLNAPEFRDQATNTLLVGAPVAAGFQLKMTLLSPAPPGTTSAGTIYYTTDGTDPRVIYSGAVTGSAQAFTAPLTLNNSTRFKARALNGTTWSALNEAQFTVGPSLIPIVITEVMYDPPGGPAHEFVELTNTGSEDINLNGFYFEGVEFVFPFGAVLGAGTRIVIASNNAPASFAAQYPGIIVAGYFGGSLQNESERIALKAPDGSTVTSLRYSDALPWPRGAAGDGYSLEIVDEDGDANSPFNWKASGGLKGTPGTPNSPTSSPAIEITEILAENIAAVSNGGVFSDYVELHNTTAAAIDISGWSLITDSSYLFPPGSLIPAGGYAVVWFDNALAAPGFHTGGLGSLARAGGSVHLRLPDGRSIVDGIRYGNQISDASLGRVAGEWTLTQPSPGAFNSARPIASPAAHLVFNEWLAAPDEGGRRWIEVHNKHASLPVALRGVIFKNGVFSDRYDIPAFVAPLGHLQLFTDEAAGIDSVDFLLSPVGASLQLLDEDGGTLDAVTFAAQTINVSGGRLPDGAATLSTFPNGGSPGASNYGPNNGGPVINEVLARNVNGETAPWGTRADWVELYNPATTAADISGMRLGYRNDFSQAWRIPAATTIPGGGYLAIWCDPDRSASTESGAEMNSALPLSDDKGALYLFNAAGQLIDTIAWGFQIADLSVGRTAAAGWRLLTSPTRRTINTTPALLGVATNLRINEWFDNGNGTDWFELYNRDAAPVELSGLYLTDNPSEPGLKKFLVSSLSFIAARGWVQFFGEGSPPAGRSQVNFGIEAEGEYLRLSGADLALIDAVSFGAQIMGKSQGRVPDGEAVQGGLTPTPATTNSTLIQITDQPDSQTVPVGGTVTFRVTVSGAGPFTYQWRFKGDILPGATGDTLMRSSVAFNDDGDYEVSVSNAAGTVVSEPAILFVQHTYAQWKALFFSGAEQANELVSGANADPEGDGIPNGQEYFHNLNPRAATTLAEQASALPRAGVEPASGPPQFVTLTYRRSNRTTAAGVIYQSSKGLESATWEPLIPDAVEQLGPDLFSDDPRIRVKFAIQPSETRRFLRLLISP